MLITNRKWRFVFFGLFLFVLTYVPSKTFAVPVTCDLYQVPCYETDDSSCLTKKGTGDIWIIIHGPTKITQSLTGIVIDTEDHAPSGQEKLVEFFVHDSEDQDIGQGFLNGLLYFDPDNNQGTFHIWQDLEIVTHYAEWMNLVGFATH